MGMAGSEGATRAFIAALKAEMPAALAAVEAEWADGIPLPAPADDSYFFVTKVMLQKWPAVFVIPMPESAKDKDLAGGSDYDFALQVDVIVPAKDQEAAQVLLWRYWQAVKEVMSVNGILPGYDVTEIEVKWDEPVLTLKGFSEPVRDIPGLFIVSTTERA